MHNNDVRAFSQEIAIQTRCVPLTFPCISLTIMLYDLLVPGPSGNTNIVYCRLAETVRKEFSGFAVPETLVLSPLIGYSVEEKAHPTLLVDLLRYYKLSKL